MGKSIRHLHRAVPLTAILAAIALLTVLPAKGQVNAEQMMRVGQNALFFEDYMLSIQYFNQAIQAKPYLAQPYFFRSIAKLNLEDYRGAEADATEAIERNPFITDAYEVRGVARQNMDKLPEAVSDYRHALSLQPNSRGILYNMALAQQDMDDLEGADVTFGQLLSKFPGYENGYVGRARLRLEQADTIGAKADLDKALSINKQIAAAYMLRAQIAIHHEADYAAAKADLDEAIKLQPRYASLYVNRAFLRYNLDDYFGAMADYDYAIQLDPLNAAALYNRGLLRAEVHDNDKAIADFTAALRLDDRDHRARYNRALLRRETRDFSGALADIDVIVEAYPDFPEARYLRSSILKAMGQTAKAENDFNKAVALTNKLKPADQADSHEIPSLDDSDDPRLTSERFRELLTVETDVDSPEEYNNKSIRGRVQDRNIPVEIQPMFVLSYYSSPTALRESAYYLREIDEVNATQALHFAVQLVPDAASQSDVDLLQRHSQSIEQTNDRLSTHPARAIDFFGRAMDFITVRDYAPAIADLTRAIELAPDFSLAYFQRAIARYKARQARHIAPQEAAPEAPQLARRDLDEIFADFDMAARLSPSNPYVHFDKGNIYAELQDLTSALSCFSKAIELKPDMGEAYYNRGYVYMKLGDRQRGLDDLSRAGELGVVPSYNLLKRMSK